MSCLDDGELVDLVEGRLDPADAARARAHVRACEACALLVADAERVALEVEAPWVNATLARPPAPAPAIAPGASVGRYQVIERLGQGGMGVVYLAQDPELDRKVALKLLRADVAAPSEDARRAVLREAQAMARLSSPHVVGIHDIGTAGEQVFIAMEYVAGTTLTRWLRGGRRAWPEVLEAFRAAGQGLAVAHATGLVHRDFKPDNVLVARDGRVCVTDFGLARLAGDGAGPPASPDGSTLSGSLTRTGVLVGTPAYMAPEQARGGAIDARTDMFSYCIALFEALHGVRPFDGSTLAERLQVIDAGRLPAARARGVPRWIDRALARGLRALPEERFAGMDELLAALRPRRRLGPGRVAAAAALLAVGVGLGAWRLARRGAPAGPAPVEVRSVTRITFAPGCEEFPSFTPDGRTLVFDAEADEAQQLFALDLETRALRQLTREPGTSMMPILSPDGQNIAYVHDREGPRQLRVLALDGGAAPRTLGGTRGGRAWLSPRRLASVGLHGEVRAWDLDAPAPKAQLLYPPPGGRRIGLIAAFSDGVLAVDWDEPPQLVGIGVLGPDGLRVIAEHLPYVSGSVATSREAVYFVRRTGAANELVRAPRDGGEPLVVGGGIAPSAGVAVAAGGARLAFSTCSNHNRLVRLDGERALVDLEQGARWDDSLFGLATPREALVLSDRSGHDQLYLLDLATGVARVVSGPETEQGAVSHDGRWLLYARRDPNGLWIARLDGGAPPRRLTEGDDHNPLFSHDDQQVVFIRDDRLHIMPVAGGAVVQLSPVTTTMVDNAARDERLYFVHRDEGYRVVMVTDEHGAPARPVSPPITGTLYSLVRSPDGTKLAMGHNGYEILELDLEHPGPLRLKHKMNRWVDSIAWAPDGERILAALSVSEGDLWLAEGRFR